MNQTQYPSGPSGSAMHYAGAGAPPQPAGLAQPGNNGDQPFPTNYSQYPPYQHQPHQHQQHQSPPPQQHQQHQQQQPAPQQFQQQQYPGQGHVASQSGQPLAGASQYPTGGPPAAGTHVPPQLYQQGYQQQPPPQQAVRSQEPFYGQQQQHQQPQQQQHQPQQLAPQHAPQHQPPQPNQQPSASAAPTPNRPPSSQRPSPPAQPRSPVDENVYAAIQRDQAIVVPTMSEGMMSEFARKNAERLSRMTLNEKAAAPAPASTNPFDSQGSDPAQPAQPPSNAPPGRNLVQEAGYLTNVITDFLRKRRSAQATSGRFAPAEVADVSAHIKDATQQTWSTYWQPVHGRLNEFVKSKSDDFSLIRNKYVVLRGFEQEADIPPEEGAAPISTPVPEAVQPVNPFDAMPPQGQYDPYGHGAHGTAAFDGSAFAPSSYGAPPPHEQMFNTQNSYGNDPFALPASSQSGDAGFSGSSPYGNDPFASPPGQYADAGSSFAYQPSSSASMPSYIAFGDAGSSSTGAMASAPPPPMAADNNDDWTLFENNEDLAPVVFDVPSWQPPPGGDDEDPLAAFTSPDATNSQKEEEERKARKAARKEEKRKKKQEAEDEKLARQLQEEEDARGARNVSGGDTGAGATGTGASAVPKTAAEEPLTHRLAFTHPEVRELAEAEVGKDNIRILAGFSVIKFGRGGRPHQRKMWVNSTLTHLAWESAQLNDLRGLELARVVGIRIGEMTPTIRRTTKDRNKVRNLCFSLVTHERTLDLQACSVIQRDALAAALRKVIEFNHRHKPRRLDKFKTELLV